MDLKRKLLNNQLTIGSWITLAHPGIAEIMADAGFDWLTIDLEHSVTDLFQAEELIRTIRLKNTPALVRVSYNDHVQIKRVMDAGASGIIVPMVLNESDAINAVKAVYYPPKGIRGVGLARAQKYGADFQSYKEWLEKEAIVIVQIEHIESVKNLKKILKVEGVDGVIIGPYDLSASMGMPGEFQRREVQVMIEEILSVTRDFNKPAGIHIIEPNTDELKKRIDQGYNFLAYSLDIRMIDVASRSAITTLKGKNI